MRRLVCWSRRPSTPGRDTSITRLASGRGGLADAVWAANAAMWQRADADPALERMGTTLTAVVVHACRERTEPTVANVGDSRAYLLQDGQLNQLTRDHSLVQELVEAGRLTGRQVAGHPQRGLLTRGPGMAPTVAVAWC